MLPTLYAAFPNFTVFIQMCVLGCKFRFLSLIVSLKYKLQLKNTPGLCMALGSALIQL